MPRGPLDTLKKVLGMHAQVVTKPSLATSGQLTNIIGDYVIVYPAQKPEASDLGHIDTH